LSDRGSTSSDVEHWDDYWRAWDKSTSKEEAGARDPAPLRHWAAYFEREFFANRQPSLIDIACGHGPVTGVAIEAAKRTGVSLDAYCADYSQSAVDELRRRYPGVEGVVCDARAIPFADRRFDYVVSQFGIEYAGTDAFSEAERLVADGGALEALVHLADGQIHAECADNFAVVVALRESDFMILARAAFEAGFALLAGRVSNADFQAADKQLAPAVEAAKQLLREKGPTAAGGLLTTLYRDIGYMYTRLQNYVPDEVFAWFDGMAAELVSYEGRMASMTRSAVDDKDIRAIVEQLASAELVVEDPAILSLAESGKPAAWILSARRPA
jgi:SAM-dependent methyltransferase